MLEISLGEHTQRQLLLDEAKRFPQNRWGEFVVAGLAHYLLIEYCCFVHDRLLGAFEHKRTICSWEMPMFASCIKN